MKEYKKKFKLFLAGQEDLETSYLSKMSKDGYHLDHVNFCVQYVFKKGESADYTYYIDYKESGNTEKEYKLMYSDVGLDYIDKCNGYYYFRGEKGSDTLDIINNDKGRYMGRLGVMKKTFLIIGVAYLTAAGFSLALFRTYEYPYKLIVYSCLPVGLIFLGFALNIQLKIKDMKKLGVKEHYKSKLKDYSNFYTAAIGGMVATGLCVLSYLLYMVIKLNISFYRNL